MNYQKAIAFGGHSAIVYCRLKCESIDAIGNQRVSFKFFLSCFCYVYFDFVSVYFCLCFAIRTTSCVNRKDKVYILRNIDDFQLGVTSSPFHTV